MNLPPQTPRASKRLVACYRSGEVMRSRSVSAAVPTGTLDIPAPPPRVLSDWEREIATQLFLEPGDVEQMPLARTQTRWPAYGACLQAMLAWTRALGLDDEVMADADIALMACRGARYHHDAGQYGSAAFCNLFLSEDKGLDVVFPVTGQRIPLTRGTAMVFDTGQPHGVVLRGQDTFREADFASGEDFSQLFLTWELPIEATSVAQTLGIAFDVDVEAALRLDEEQLRVNGAPAIICPETGRWLAAA